MGGSKKGKYKIGIILAAIIGILGFGAIRSVLTKGVKAVKINKTANKIQQSGKTIVKAEEGLSFSENIKFLEESHSVIDTANKIKESGE